jgi:hypothetical protein
MKLNNERLSARAASIGILLAGFFAEPPADAAWDFVPDLNLSAQSEDNPYYLPSSLSALQQSASSVFLDMILQMATYNERSVLLFEPHVVSYKYSGNSNDSLDSNNWYLNGNGQYRWKTAVAGFSALYRRERLASGEFGTIDFNLDTQNPDTGDTGRVVLIDQYRKFYYVTPYLSFDLSPRNTLRFDLTNSGVSYSGGNLSFRTGYKDTRFSTSLQRNVDERTNVAAVMSVDHYQADVNTNEFQTVTVQGSFRRPINQLWTFNMAAGVLRSDYTVFDLRQRPTTSATTDYTASIGLRKRGERTRLNVDLTRNAYPSSNSYSSVRREARVYMERDLTPRLGFDFGVRLQETRTLGNVNSTNDRNYATAEMEFNWAIKPVLFFVAGLEYRTQEFTNDILNRGKTDAASLSAGIRYRGLSKRNPPRSP